jgi:O-antigen ligase
VRLAHDARAGAGPLEGVGDIAHGVYGQVQLGQLVHGPELGDDVGPAAAHSCRDRVDEDAQRRRYASSLSTHGGSAGAEALAGDSVARRVWATWSSPRLTRLTRLLTLGGAATLFLSATATFHASYTVRVPYLLFGAAVVVGAPVVISGWRRLPAWVRWTALALFLAYVAATVGGDEATLQNARGGSHRDLVYLSDLALGLLVLGLLAGQWGSAEAGRDLLVAVTAGVAISGAYGVYQWFAQHYGLPFADVNNTLDSNGVSAGASQGKAIFGWERVRGTFIEPHFFAAYLAAGIPLCCLVAWRARGQWRLLTGAGLGAALIALGLTTSVPAWAALVVAAIVAAALWSMGRGLEGASALAVAACVVVAIGGVAAAASPSMLRAATGRSTQELTYTTSYRTDIWKAAATVWAARPVLGFGPGQSSVRVAQADPNRTGDARNILASAQALWAASLIDAGVLGFGCWLLLLGGVVWFTGRSLFARAGPVLAATFASATAALLAAQISGDRLELAAWVFVGLALAAATCEPSAADRGQGDQQPGGGTG